MAEKNIEQDREVRREEIEHRRNEQRSNTLDDKRRLNIPEGEIKEIVSKLADNLKSKRITEDDLQTLYSAISTDFCHIDTLLQVQGSLRGLVGALTGSCVNKQLWSASILCYIAAVAPQVISRSASYYLVLTLDSFNDQLIVYGAYCVGNLANSSLHICQVLVEQGAFTKLLQILRKPTGHHVKTAAMSAVIRFVSTLNVFNVNTIPNTAIFCSMEHLVECMAVIPKLDFNNIEVPRCLALISCHHGYIQKTDQNYAIIVTGLFIDLLELHVSNCNVDRDCGAVYMARVLANTALNAPNSNGILSTLMSRYAYINMARILQLPNHLHQSCHWAMGNVAYYCTEKTLNRQFYEEVRNVLIRSRAP